MSDKFNLKKFKAALAEGVVKFRFKKISGEQEQRVIWATTNLDIIKANGYRFKGSDRKVSLGDNHSTRGGDHSGYAL